MKKRILSLCLVFAMLFSMFPAYATDSVAIDPSVTIINTEVNVNVGDLSRNSSAGVVYEIENDVAVSTEPTDEPSSEPSEEASAEPSVEPSTAPSEEPTEEPSAEVSTEPSTEPEAPSEDVPSDESTDAEGEVGEAAVMSLAVATALDYSVVDGPVVINDPAETYTISGTSTTNGITVAAAGTYYITLNNVNIDLSALNNVAALSITSDAVVYLTLSGTNYLRSAVARAGIEVPEGCTLYIDGNGSLEVIGGAPMDEDSTSQEAGAGIGGNSGHNAGTIVINSGTITAKGGPDAYYGAAGIGGGSSYPGKSAAIDTECSSTSITINGGTVNAYGSEASYYGASGIGGGSHGNGNNITINGGMVNAYGSSSVYYGAAGIGGGYMGSSHTIRITNGTVNAYVSQDSNSTGAGIGGGYKGDGWDIAISGGTVTTYACEGMIPTGAGIGGGSNGNGYDIAISGGTVRANSGVYGAGIGGGYEGDGYNITITGGSVTAASADTPGGTMGSAGIGGGPNGKGYNITINGTGTSTATVSASGSWGSAGIGGGMNQPGHDIEITGNVNVYADGEDGPNSAYTKGGAGIGGGNGGYGANIYIHGENVRVRAYGYDGGAGIGGGCGGAGINIVIEDCTATSNNSANGYAVFAQAYRGLNSVSQGYNAYYHYHQTNNGVTSKYYQTYGSTYSNGAAIGSGARWTQNNAADIAPNLANIPNDLPVATNIAINNSNVYAVGGYGASIGTGEMNTRHQSGADETFYVDIDISGSKVYVNSATAWNGGSGYDGYGAGIGTGAYNNAAVVKLNIENSSEITAYSQYGAAIGLGYDNDDINIISTINECNTINLYAGYGGGYSTASSACCITADMSIANIENISGYARNSWSSNGSGYYTGGAAVLGSGSSTIYSNINYTVSNITTIDFSTKNAYSWTQIGLGMGSSNDYTKMTMTVDEVGGMTLRGSPAIGMGSYSDYAVFDMDVTNCGDITIPYYQSYNSAYGIGTGYSCNHSDVDINIASCGDIDISIHHGVGIGVGPYNTGSSGKLHGEFTSSTIVTVQDCGDITISMYPTHNTAVTGIGVGGDCSYNDAVVNIQNCGDIKIYQRGNTQYQTGIGSGYSTDYANIAVNIIDCGAIDVDVYTYANEIRDSVSIGANYNTNSIVNIRIERDASFEKVPIDVDYDYYAVGIGARGGTATSTTYPYELTIDIINYGNLTIYNQDSYGAGIGVYTENNNDELLVANITIENCGAIKINTSSYHAGIGNYYGCNVDTNITIHNCSDIAVTTSSYGAGIGFASVNRRYYSGAAQTQDIIIDNCGYITISTGYDSVGVGAYEFGTTNSNSNTANTFNIEITNSGAISASTGQWGTGIGIRNGYINYRTHTASGKILLENNTSVTSKVNCDGTAIGIGNGYDVGLDIDIINCGVIVANGASGGLSNGNARGVGIGVGGRGQFWSNYSTDASYPRVVDITISDCTSVTATGSDKGAAIGTGWDTYGDLESVVINIEGVPVTATSGTYSAAIGTGYYNRQSGNKVEVNISDTTVTATSGHAAAIGTGEENAGGTTYINLTNCTINATSGSGTDLGLSDKNTANTILRAVLTDCTADFTSTGFSAGTGFGLDCEGCYYYLTIDGGNITAQGSSGGAGIGCGPLGANNHLALVIDGDAIVTATGSSSDYSEYELLGSVGDVELDQIARKTLVGSGAGIGGAGGQNCGSITINSGTVTATGGGMESHSAAGIGSGQNCGSVGTITINGGTVTARGGSSDLCGAAGIGGGYGSNGATVKITGGVVYAYGSNGSQLGGAGIGGGPNGSGGSTTITGGEVNAYGSERGAAIGGGSNGNGGTTVISGGTILAKGGLYDTAAIGGGTNAETTGTLTLSGNPSITAFGSSANPPVTSKVITTTNRLIQGNLVNVPTTDTNIYVRSEDGSEEVTVVLPAYYDAFAVTLGNTLPEGTIYHIYQDLDEDGTVTEYLLCDQDKLEDFPVSLSASYFAPNLNIVRFFTFTFVTNGGTEVEAQQVRIDDPAIMPEAPTRRNYVFAGWFADEELTQSYDFSTPITENTTIYANWLEGEGTLYIVEHYKQTLDASGDVYTVSNIEYYLDKLDAIVTATPMEYTGFHINEEHEDTVDSGMVNEFETLTLKLYYDRDWIVVKVENVEFTDDSQRTIEAPYGTSILLYTPAKTGFTFDHWSKVNQDGETLPLTPVLIESLGDTIYANWILKDGIPYQVRYFLRTLDGVYQLQLKEDFVGTALSTVTATIKDFTGFHVNHSISDENYTGIVQEDGSTVLRVYYDRDIITVNLLNGYTAENAVVKEYGDLAELPIPSREGYTFEGWWTDEGKLVPEDALIQEIGANATAKWSASSTTKYTVRYYLQNSEGEYEIKDVNDLQGETLTIVNAQIRTYRGYTFNEELSTTSGEVHAAGTLLLVLYYDINQYDVLFEPNGGTAVDAQYDIYYNTTMVEPEAPTKTGYTFAGWYSDPDLCLYFNTMTPITGDTTLYAKWTPNKDTLYTVNHYVETPDGSEYELVHTDIWYGTTDSTVTALTRVYDGCVEDTTHADRVVSGTVAPDGSLVLSVYYMRNPVVISFDSNGGSDIADVTIRCGSTTTSPTPTRAGYDFVGWFTTPLLTTAFDFEKAVTSNILLYAKWSTRDDTRYVTQYYLQDANDADVYTLKDTIESAGTTEDTVAAQILSYEGFHQNEAHDDRLVVGKVAGDGSLVLAVYYDRDTYTIQFDSMGGSDVANQTVLFEGKVTEVSPTRTGYDFAGWYTTPLLTTEFDFDTIITSSITLYAKWTPRNDTVYTTVYYKQDADDLTKYVEAERVPATGTTESTVAAKILTYDGFHQNEAHDARCVIGEIVGDGSLVLSVYYDRDTYSVKFNSNGGSEVAAQTVVHEGKVTPVEPTKTGYTFVGWHTNIGLTEAFDYGTLMTDNAELFAKWAPAKVKYTVYHYQQSVDGTKYELSDTDNLEALTEAEVKAVAKTYAGFVENGTYTGRVPEGVVKADGSLKLSLYYDRTTVKVTYDADGGTPVASAEVLYGAATSEPDVPTKTGYTFDGWYADELFITEFDFEASLYENTTVYVKWMPADGVTYKIHYYTQNLNDNEYTLASTVTRAGTTGEKITVPEPNIEGYTLNLSVPGTVNEGVVSADGLLELTVYLDRNVYTLSFEPNGGTTVAPETGRFGTIITAPTTSKVGYVFSGWYVDDVFSAQYDFSEGLSATRTLYAKWTASSSTQYVVNYYVQNINDDNYSLHLTEKLTGMTGSTVTAPVKTFDGMTEDVLHTDRFISAVVLADGSLVLSRYYTRDMMTVSFVANGGSPVSAQALRYGSTIESPVTTRAGYTFGGWYLDETFETAYDFTAPVTADATLYARWIANPDTPYTVRYYLQDKNGLLYELAEQITLYGTTDTETTIDAKNFTGFTEVDHELTLKSGTITADGKLVLSVYYTRNYYDVVFEEHGGTKVDDQSVLYDTFMDTITTERVGYHFGGWYTDEDFSVSYLIDKMPVLENLTLHAKWIAAGDTPYTVEYWGELADGTHALLEEFELSGTTEFEVEAEIKEYPGYHFSEENEGNILKTVILADGSAVLRVFYDLDVHTITFESNNGEPAQTKEIKHGVVYGELPVVKKSGYDFVGWFTADDIEVTPETVALESITVYAKWTETPQPSSPATYYTITLRRFYDDAPMSEEVDELREKNTRTYTFASDNWWYGVSSVLVNGEEMGPITEYTVERAEQDYVIEVTYSHICYSEPYDDLYTSAWYHVFVDYAIYKGYFIGVSETMFEPESPFTRAQAAQVIARFIDAEIAEKAPLSPFADVPNDAWYTPVVLWAEENGYMIGYSDDMFGPQDAMSREQMILVLYRIAGSPVGANANGVKTFIDYEDISPWALDAMNWAVENDILIGDDRNKLLPQKFVSRAEAAAIFMRYDDKFRNEKAEDEDAENNE